MTEQDRSILFRTSAKINYQLPGLTTYDSIRATGLGERFPHIEPDQEDATEEALRKLNLVSVETVIFSADTEQARDTAEIASHYLGLPVTLDSDLNPPQFDLADFMSNEEFEELGAERYNSLRARYLRGFYDNQFLQSKEDLYRRFVELQGRYTQTEATTVLAFSHAFLMKFFEVFHVEGSGVLNDYALLEKAWEPKINPYGRFGDESVKGGFDLPISSHDEN